jgi:hypothetical protein
MHLAQKKKRKKQPQTRHPKPWCHQTHNKNQWEEKKPMRYTKRWPSRTLMGLDHEPYKNQLRNQNSQKQDEK